MRGLVASAVVAAACAVPCASCAHHDDPAPAHHDWSVSGGAIRDKSGRTVILRGANVSGAHKTAPYLASFGPDDYEKLHDDYGFDAIRFLFVWAAVEPQKGAYDENFLNEVETRIGWARDAGLLVVLDMHQDLYGEGFLGGDGAPKWTCSQERYDAFKPTDPWFFGSIDPNVEACVDDFYAEGGPIRASFVAAWKHVAERFAKTEGVLGFDILNEPSWGSYTPTAFEADKLQPFYVEVATAVRAAAPEWLIFAEPGASRNVGYATGLTKLPFDRVVYAPHAYDNDAESGDGFDAAHRAAFMQHIADLRAEADMLGAALFLGEYGGSTDAPGIAEYMGAAYDGAGAVGASAMYWAFDKSEHGYGLLHDDGSEKDVLLDLVGRPYPSRVAGALLSFAFDGAAKALTFTYAPDASVHDPTEIAIPSRMFPTGADVECGGCTVEQAPGLVRLMTPPQGNPVTVVVRPHAG